MPRKQYPSDVARLRVRPHVKVHLTTRSHHRTAEAWAEPEMRGMIVGLWQLAAEAFAGKTGDTVTLNRSDIAWISGRHRRDVALTSLQRLANVMGYSLRLRGDVAEITIRNFAKKQGFDSATNGVTPRTTHASDSDSDSDSDSESREEKKRAAVEAPASPPPAAPVSSEPTLSRPKSRNAGRTDPPERLTEDDRRALIAWDAGKHTPHALLYAESRVLDWGRARGKQMKSWRAAVRNACRAGWAFDGYAPPRAPQIVEPRAPERVLTPEELEQARQLTAEYRARRRLGSGMRVVS